MKCYSKLVRCKEKKIRDRTVKDRGFIGSLVVGVLFSTVVSCNMFDCVG